MSHSVKFKIAIFLIALVILGVIFISWGLDDIGGLLAHPARATLLLFLLTQLMVFGWFIPLGWMRSRLPEQSTENNMLVAFIGAMGVVLFLMISPFSDRNEWMLLGGGGDIWRYVGLFLFTIGAFLSIWASVHMCQSLKNKQNYQLITDGPFQLVRHPRDLGTILAFIGIPLVFLSSLGLLLAFLSSAGLFERIGREERMLELQFKDEWLEYAQQTKCLIPWV